MRFDFVDFLLRLAALLQLSFDLFGTLALHQGLGLSQEIAEQQLSTNTK
jgi:hypothetical protein